MKRTPSACENSLRRPTVSSGEAGRILLLRTRQEPLERVKIVASAVVLDGVRLIDPRACCAPPPPREILLTAVEIDDRQSGLSALGAAGFPVPRWRSHAGCRPSRGCCVADPVAVGGRVPARFGSGELVVVVCGEQDAVDIEPFLFEEQ